MSTYVVPHVVERTANGSERVTDVFSRLVSERIVYIGTPVDDDVANSVIAQLLHLESVSPQSPIDLVLNAAGGTESAVLAVHDTLRYVNSPVATTVVGQVSGAAALLLAGAQPGRRLLLPHARVVLHQPVAEARGAIPDLIPEAEEVERVRLVVEGLLAGYAGKAASQLRADTDRALVLPGHAAVAYGVADEVIEARRPA
ncbi:MAG: ATP-dependent Clp protease proteolytic subunit [Arthrobacter sp.]|jgi:ATP-dependent Clp protease protease subunit|nr:ATP-dependent Clp protease proteolytic subunit [Arthrobacter sp.]